MPLTLFSVCPCCKSYEPNEHLLRTNHGIEADGSLCGYQVGAHPSFGSECVAQNLVRNHIVYALRGGRDPSRDIARGRELGLDIDAIVRAESLGAA
ncbi:hypothetical protein [Gordonia soli]|uniref:Uncharacterized protein n=1 Tax=Gordonia soli NBRC 108243 TaxID=1223545 RepID=M0QR91_9ACTN|nr:hypothetical protein [Gordonia soli]GAC70811.1 hypothetical protein GS4_41_00590 [Gordonia soli NBRC 108243]